MEMTQTENASLEVGQVVTASPWRGYFFRVYRVNPDGHLTLYGGLAGRGGLKRVGFRDAASDDVKPITDSQAKRATQTMTLIDIAQDAAPKPRGRRKS